MNYDIFFISYRESNCEDNWKTLLAFHPMAKRIHGIKGIDHSHMACNRLSATNRFWTVDGDNKVVAPLIYNNKAALNQFDLIYFQSRDPIDNTTSSLGSIKLWSKDKFINTDMSKGDFCVHATATKKSVNSILSVHQYNTTPFDAWKNSFRKMVKAFSGVVAPAALNANIDQFKNHINCVNGTNNARWSYCGYIDAEKYSNECNGNFEKINLINDYDWLALYFKSKGYE